MFHLHAEDDPPSAVAELDGPTELQFVLQAASHLLRVEHVAEDPDLGPLSLDVGVTCGQPSTAHRATHSLPHLPEERGGWEEEQILYNRYEVLIDAIIHSIVIRQ